MNHVKLTLLMTTALFSNASFSHLSYKGEETNQALRSQHNWSGFYAGVNVGSVSHTMNITDNEATSFASTLQQVADPAFTGGLQIGYREQLDLAQISGVYGLEFSGNFSNANFNKQYGSAFALYNLQATHELKELCLLQLMGGIAADRVLLFLAGGISGANVNGNVSTLNGAPFFNSFSLDRNFFSAAFGAGIEYALTDKLSARFKLDYVLPTTYSATNNVGNVFQISNNIVQGAFALNYKFL